MRMSDRDVFQTVSFGVPAEGSCLLPLIMVTSLLVFAVAAVVMFLAIHRSLQRATTITERSHVLSLEVVWTLIPAFIAIFTFCLGCHGVQQRRKAVMSFFQRHNGETIRNQTPHLSVREQRRLFRSRERLKAYYQV